jgi:hypothetical protein
VSDINPPTKRDNPIKIGAWNVLGIPRERPRAISMNTPHFFKDNQDEAYWVKNIDL